MNERSPGGLHGVLHAGVLWQSAARTRGAPKHRPSVWVAVGLASMGGFLASCAAALLEFVDVPVALLMIAISLCSYVLALASSVSAGSTLNDAVGSTFHSAAVSDNDHRGGVPHAHMQRVR